MTRLATHAIAGNLTLTKDKAVAWYALPPMRWAFRSEAEREQLVTDAASRLAQLVGKRLYLRGTTEATTVEAWREALTSWASDPLPAWHDHVTAEAKHLSDLAISDKRVFLGIELRRSSYRLLGDAADLDHLAPVLADLDTIVSGPGLLGRRARTPEVSWLMRRSVDLCGTPPPIADIDGPWEADDTAELAEGVWVDTAPYAETVHFATKGESRHVVVLALGRMTDGLPLDPWAALADRLDFPVEISATIDVLPARRVLKQARSSLLRTRSQIEHYQEQHLPPPDSLARAWGRAQEVSDEVERGFEALATRTDSWWHIAVAGRSEKEVIERSRQIVNLYGTRIAAVPLAGKTAAVRGFIPGEPKLATAYRRRLPVTTLALSMPTVTAQVGDRVGHYVGWTSGATGKGAVFMNTHSSQEQRDRSGVTLFAGHLGSGKTTAAASLVYRSVLAGVPWTVLDPAGALVKLAALPELVSNSRVVDLLHAPMPGVLSPYALIADAPKGSGDHAASMVRASRRSLLVDVLSQVLPSDLAKEGLSRLALSGAARALPAERNTSPLELIGQLRKLEDEDLRRQGKLLADFLLDLSQLPAMQLVFGTGSVDDYRHDHMGGLVVISLLGLSLPEDGKPRHDYSVDEEIAVPLLQLAAYLATRPLLEMPAGSRKGLLLDEAHAIARATSGRQLLQLLTRQSRRLNLRALFVSQTIADFEVADLLPHIDSAFIGRLEESAAQLAGCRALRIPESYAPVFGTLSPPRLNEDPRHKVREFLYADGRGGVERVTVDKTGLPEAVQEALDTTPGSQRSF